jgi:hypothetical protein
MAQKREVQESPLTQGVDEQIAYSFDFAAVGTPVSPTVAIMVVGTTTDLASTLISGAASVVGNTVLTGKVQSLTAGVVYRLECKATVSGNLLERYLIILAEQ